MARVAAVVAVVVAHVALLCGVALSESETRVSLSDLGPLSDNLTSRMDEMAAFLDQSLGLLRRAEKRIAHILQRDRNRTRGSRLGAGGAVYIRWGRSTCPEDSEMVYHGFSAGGNEGHAGSGVNTICLHSAPQFNSSFPINTTHKDYLYGVEYEDIWRSDLTNQDAPCAVCRCPSRDAAIMVPGREECFGGWHREYWGYLVGGKHGAAGNTEFICLDADPGAVEGGYSSTSAKGFYNVLYNCGAIPCPPYKGSYVVTCVVCSK